MRIPFFIPKEQKANPPSVAFADEATRGALNKAVQPNFIYNPPFGIPRFKNPLDLRRLGNTTQARMAKQTIIDEIVSVPWAVIPKEETDEIPEADKNQITEIENFLHNPNTNNESFEYILKGMLSDLLDFDSGIWVKDFDASGRMVEIRFADGATFLKNPDIHGKYETREDYIEGSGIIMEDQIRNPMATNAALGFSPVSSNAAKDKAAYFQFGYGSNSRPIAFGRKELVWFEKNPQTNQVYGKSPIESLEDVLQTLKYAIEFNLEYFEDNNVPKGFINLAGIDEDEMKQFRDKWNDLQLGTNKDGLIKKIFHRVPITNTPSADFVRVQFSSSELQLLEMQSWFSKLVWATFGVTPSELGFTENSNLATEVSQSRIFRKKAILPLLRTIEYFINNNILNEWDFGEKYKFEFNTFDIDDEKNKWELYQLQLGTGARTINEIRNDEGMEEIEEPTNAVRVTNQDLTDEEPDPNESMDNAESKSVEMEDVAKAITKLALKQEKELLSELRNNSNNRLAQVKDFNAIIRSVNNFLRIEDLKGLINTATKALYTKGLTETEIELRKKGATVNMVQTNPQEMQFLADMVFDNIKGLTEELRIKLKQQLKIGISNGEGLGKLTERVQKTLSIVPSRATMIARTESARIEEEGSLYAAQQIKSDGVSVKKWILMKDDPRTSEISRKLHAKYGSPEQAIPINENFKLNSGKISIDQKTAPFHPNDRCTVIYEI